MKRLIESDIFKPGGKVRTSKVDLDKEPELKKLFDLTNKRQREIIELQERPVENVTIAI